MIISKYIKVFFCSQSYDLIFCQQLTLPSANWWGVFHFCVIMMSFMCGYSYRTLMLVCLLPFFNHPLVLRLQKLQCYHLFSPLTVQRVLPMNYVYTSRSRGYLVAIMATCLLSMQRVIGSTKTIQSSQICSWQSGINIFQNLLE